MASPELRTNLSQLERKHKFYRGTVGVGTISAVISFASNYLNGTVESLLISETLATILACSSVYRLEKSWREITSLRDKLDSFTISRREHSYRHY